MPVEPGVKEKKKQNRMIKPPVNSDKERRGFSAR